MPDPNTPDPEPVDSGLSAGPEEPADAGLSAAPDEPAAETPGSTAPHASDPAGPDAPVGSPAETAPRTAPTAPAGGRGGCMTTMLGLFLLIAVLLGLASQL